MNSFSWRSEMGESKENRDPQEREISGLLNLYPEGEAFPLEPVKLLARSHFQNHDFEKLREQYKDQAGRRAGPRYVMNVTVLIANYFKAFRTHSLDISADGVFLNDLLPLEFANGFFDIVLIHSDVHGRKTFLVFRGRDVESPFRSHRVKFEAISPASKEKLKYLLQGAPGRY